MKEMDKRLLHRLSRLYKVQTAHYDGLGRFVEPPPEAVLGVLRMLGAPVAGMEDLADGLRQRRQFLWGQTIEPVVVAWDGGPLSFNLRLPRQLAETPVHHRSFWRRRSVDGTCRDDVSAGARCIEGVPFVNRRVTVAQPLPFGYHQLYLRIGERDLESYVLSAPSQIFASGEAGANRWGLFCPLYALTSERSWGAGDFTDLEALADFTGSLGGSLVGTLPLLATFLDEPYNPSPYAPVSRLFWNEFFLDIERIPELPRCPAARSIISTGFVTELNRLRAQPLVDYRRLMALKRKVLEALAGWLLTQASVRRVSFERFVASHPTAQDYAEFRAKVEREHKPWHQWSETARGGTLRSEDYDESVKQYHLYVQWLAQEQLGALAEKARAGGTALYLDFPLGVNRDGYDVWREREFCFGSGWRSAAGHSLHQWPELGLPAAAPRSHPAPGLPLLYSMSAPSSPLCRPVAPRPCHGAPPVVLDSPGIRGLRGCLCASSPRRVLRHRQSRIPSAPEPNRRRKPRHGSALCQCRDGQTQDVRPIRGPIRCRRRPTKRDQLNPRVSRREFEHA
jgi:4-alpha-glucanotransferase